MTDKKAREILNILKEYERAYQYSKEEVVGALDMANKALEQASWIPVSEGLPKETGSYLVTIGFGNDKDAVAFRYYYADIKAWSGTYITAWMPKPQPYKECDKNDNNKV